MENRNTETTIFRASNPEELIVFHASSLQDEIRFYLNDTQYITAIEKGEGNVSVEIGEEVEREEENKKSTLTIIKENFKEFFKLFSVLILSLAALMAVLFVINSLIDNILIYLIAMNVMFSMYSIISIVILETRTTPPTLKSKHSAEHMMVNFLENNKRLPKNMQEVRKSSRFSTDCGSRNLIKGIAEDLISKILASILAVAANALYLVFFENAIGELIVFLGVYYLTSFIVGRLLKKHGKMGFVINPIKRVLTNIAQCANTTKKVEDKDIILAYCVARVWMQVVYPEFYKQEDDVFMNNYSS